MNTIIAQDEQECAIVMFGTPDVLGLGLVCSGAVPPGSMAVLPETAETDPVLLLERLITARAREQILARDLEASQKALLASRKHEQILARSLCRSKNREKNLKQFEQTLKDREQILIGEANCSFFREAKLVQELEESRRLLKKHSNSYSKYVVWFVFFVLCYSLWVAVNNEITITDGDAIKKKLKL